jgi:hypothetical protein
MMDPRWIPLPAAAVTFNCTGVPEADIGAFAAELLAELARLSGLDLSKYDLFRVPGSGQWLFQFSGCLDRAWVGFMNRESKMRLNFELECNDGSMRVVV